MINATSITSGITTHYITKTIDEKIVAPSQEESPELCELKKIAALLNPQEKYNIDLPLALQPYPSEYVIDEEWYQLPHLCIFFSNSTPIRFDIEGIGTYLKTVGPGWVQCDVKGRISTTDSTNHNVIISYRIDQIGVSL